MRIVFGLLFISACSILFSQNIPDFSFYLKVEDSQGRKDSVWLGYDMRASIFVDQSFGEEDITDQPMDSLLEIRSCLAQQPHNYHSKSQVVNWSCNSTLKYFQIALSIYAKDYPIRLSWDSAPFAPSEGPCHQWTTLVGDFNYFNFPLPTFQPTFLGRDSSLILYGLSGSNNYQAEIENGQTKSVQVLYFAWIENDLSGGGASTRLEHHWERDTYRIRQRKNILSIGWTEGSAAIMDWELSDFSGKKLLPPAVKEAGQLNMDMSNMAQGGYLWRGRNRAGQWIYRKIYLIK